MKGLRSSFSPSNYRELNDGPSTNGHYNHGKQGKRKANAKTPFLLTKIKSNDTQPPEFVEISHAVNKVHSRQKKLVIVFYTNNQSKNPSYKTERCQLLS